MYSRPLQTRNGDLQQANALPSDWLAQVSPTKSHCQRGRLQSRVQAGDGLAFGRLPLGFGCVVLLSSGWNSCFCSPSLLAIRRCAAARASYQWRPPCPYVFRFFLTRSALYASGTHILLTCAFALALGRNAFTLLPQRHERARALHNSSGRIKTNRRLGGKQ